MQTLNERFRHFVEREFHHHPFFYYAFLVIITLVLLGIIIELFTPYAQFVAYIVILVSITYCIIAVFQIIKLKRQGGIPKRVIKGNVILIIIMGACLTYTIMRVL
ncbi:hypothetical protein JCM19037_3002 [Geomicrobium sp. JCM 19037]|uniref:hypothetical protein n=1 Tax=unclassified Geomicrobium TaxID=2628951 RepID=UPI00045F2BDD|nr:hypothetical protein [Geomicrobium sp. JCM 19037]GAK04571.1 hypothetical protein JCM19037_3002 [Geomicrobium sp. JCM 19037]